MREKDQVITEISNTPFLIKEDSVRSFGYMPAGRTDTYVQEVEGENTRLRTKITPNKDRSGYDVETQSWGKAREIQVPVEKKTYTRESSIGVDKSVAVATSVKDVSWWQKYISRFPAGAAVFVVALIVLILLIRYFVRK